MTVETAKIRIEGAAKSFGANLVLDGVDLEIGQGLNTVLIGAAATGKTVLMKCLLGLHRLDRGRILIDGRDIAGMGSAERSELMNRVGALFQYGGLFDSLPVWENIAFKLINVHGLPRAKARDIAVEKLALVGLGAAVADLSPASLSGGMQKRVGLARAITGEPEILVLDNPTAGLDPIMTKQINRLIASAMEELGATVFAITSDMKAAREESQRLAMINGGRIVWYGPTEAVESSDNPYLQQMIHGRAEGPIKMRLKARV